jgi:hypothetical protein
MRPPYRSLPALAKALLALALVGFLGSAAPARAEDKEAEPARPAAVAKLPWLPADVTRVATALEDDKPVEAFLSVAYEFQARRAAIKREWELNSTSNGYGTFKDLRYKQDRHLLRLRGEIGFLWDLSLHVEAPIVLSDQRSLGFDQDLGGNCVYPQDVPAGSSEAPSCVNELNSATLRDGIVPGSFGTLNSAHGFDAQHAGQLFQGGDPTVFRGIRRAGLESLNIGVDWALLAQRKDDTKPTWVVSAEFRLSLGTPMRFDRTAYDSAGKYLGSNSVTDGVHYVKLGTTVSKRWSLVEPYASYYWIYPMVVRDSSGFKDYGGGQKGWKPQQHAGTQFGFELVPWENRKAYQKIAIDLRGIIEAHFQGRGYSEIWEMLAGSPALDPQPQPSNNGNPLMKPAGKGLYPGITDIENYFTYGAQLGLVVRAGRYLKFRGFFGVQGAQRHIISFADAGKDLDSSGKVEQQGAQAAAEVNPIHRPLIDFVGRRYVVDETTIYTVMLQGEAVF